MAAAMLVSGCVFTRESFTPVRYFDIGNPDPAKFAGIHLNVGQFSVAGPYRQEMVIRTVGNELVKDSFNRWALPPDAMLSRYFRIAFAEGRGRTDYTLSGSILSFEADLPKKEAVLTIEYRLVPPAEDTVAAAVEKTCTFRGKIEGNGAEAFAGAMSSAVAEFANSLAGARAGTAVKTK